MGKSKFLFQFLVFLTLSVFAVAPANGQVPSDYDGVLTGGGDLPESEGSGNSTMMTVTTNSRFCMRKGPCSSGGGGNRGGNPTDYPGKEIIVAMLISFGNGQTSFDCSRYDDMYQAEDNLGDVCRTARGLIQDYYAGYRLPLGDMIANRVQYEANALNITNSNVLTASIAAGAAQLDKIGRATGKYDTSVTDFRSDKTFKQVTDSLNSRDNFETIDLDEDLGGLENTRVLEQAPNESQLASSGHVRTGTYDGRRVLLKPARIPAAASPFIDDDVIWAAKHEALRRNMPGIHMPEIYGITEIDGIPYSVFEFIDDATLFKPGADLSGLSRGLSVATEQQLDVIVSSLISAEIEPQDFQFLASIVNDPATGEPMVRLSLIDADQFVQLTADGLQRQTELIEVDSRLGNMQRDLTRGLYGDDSVLNRISGSAGVMFARALDLEGALLDDLVRTTTNAVSDTPEAAALRHAKIMKGFAIFGVVMGGVAFSVGAAEGGWREGVRSFLGFVLPGGDADAATTPNTFEEVYENSMASFRRLLEDVDPELVNDEARDDSTFYIEHFVNEMYWTNRSIRPDIRLAILRQQRRFMSERDSNGDLLYPENFLAFLEGERGMALLRLAWRTAMPFNRGHFTGHQINSDDLKYLDPSHEQIWHKMIEEDRDKKIPTPESAVFHFARDVSAVCENNQCRVVRFAPSTERKSLFDLAKETNLEQFDGAHFYKPNGEVYHIGYQHSTRSAVRRNGFKSGYAGTAELPRGLAAAQMAEESEKQKIVRAVLCEAVPGSVQDHIEGMTPTQLTEYTYNSPVMYYRPPQDWDLELTPQALYYQRLYNGHFDNDNLDVSNPKEPKCTKSWRELYMQYGRPTG